MAPTIKNKTARSTSMTLPARTEILVNTYDLLPQGKLPTLLWHIGIPLLHTGVVIKRWNKEFAFGGHDVPGISGVFSTHPRREPSGGTFRRELLQGFTCKTDDELGTVLEEATQKFQGTTYDLLNCNCNHFTYFLCEKLTNKSPPAWLNRAASIARALPCMVPREWISSPEYANVDGESMAEDEEDDGKAMLWHESYQPLFYHGQLMDDLNDENLGQQNRKCRRNDNAICSNQEIVCRNLPPSERAPLPVRQN